MGKTAFLFSGQGAQRAGMGKEFYEHFASVRALFDAAEELRPGTLQQMFAGSDDELRQTENTQPCLYLADLAAAYALRDSGLQPEAVAGFSLGEIPALAFAGAYDGMTGFRLACARGASMARAGKNVNASMAAIVKLPDETVERLCAAYDHVWPVNYNCDGQIAVSGDRDELERLYADVAAAGGRSMPLNVSGGFHSPYMDPASAEFGAILADTPLQKPTLPAYANRTAEPYGENVRELLTQQVDELLPRAVEKRQQKIAEIRRARQARAGKRPGEVVAPVQLRHEPQQQRPRCIHPLHAGQLLRRGGEGRAERAELADEPRGERPGLLCARARVQQQGQQLLVREGVRRALQKAPQQIGRGSVHRIASFALMEYGIL